MKKLIIALGIIVGVCSVQAAQIKWSASNLFSGYSVTEGTTTTKYTGTVYLFDAATIGQDALFAAVAEEVSSFTAKAIGSATMTTAGVVPATTTTYGSAGTSYDFYFAVLEGDALYLSNVKSVTTSGSETVATTVAFGTQNNSSTTFSATALSSTYAGAWHWSSVAVPEPTSGLLMLLGMAGLALRRRRA